jgi:hypothetical protein
MRGRLGKYFQLSRTERRLFWSAFVQLGRARWSLARKPFTKQISGLSRLTDPADARDAVGDGQLALAEAVGDAIGRAANQLPWESSCLVRVLAAQRMLQARGVPGAFFIGADKGRELGEVEFAAHAWLMCGNRFVTGEAGHEKYTVISGFAWGSSVILGAGPK